MLREACEFLAGLGVKSAGASVVKQGRATTLYAVGGVLQERPNEVGPRVRLVGAFDGLS